MKKLIFLAAFLIFSQIALAEGSIKFSAGLLQTQRIIRLFKGIKTLISIPNNSSGETECGTIFLDDSNKFGCKATGNSADAIAAECPVGHGRLSCSGFGSSRICSCVFNF